MPLFKSASNEHHRFFKALFETLIHPLRVRKKKTQRQKSPEIWVFRYNKLL